MNFDFELRDSGIVLDERLLKCQEYVRKIWARLEDVEEPELCIYTEWEVRFISSGNR